MTPRPSPLKIAEQKARLDVLRNMVGELDECAMSHFSRRDELQRCLKASRDFVTSADQAVETLARNLILTAFPGDRVVGEEQGGDMSGNYWLIDPIDGTSNFLSGLPFWAISIAYVVEDHPVIGMVSMPVLKRAALGGAEFPLMEMDGVPAGPGEQSLMFGIGRNNCWPMDEHDLLDELLRSADLMPVAYGSCAVSLFFAATGALAGYVEGRIGFWDCAGGIALCEAAGRNVSFVADRSPEGSYVAVGPDSIAARLFGASQGQAD